MEETPASSEVPGRGVRGSLAISFMAFRRIARVGEIPSGQTRFFEVNGVPLVLANLESVIYAVDGLCPHQHNPLKGAQLWGHLVTCPWHQFQYDVRTGENVFPGNVYPGDMPQLTAQLAPLKTYRVEIKEGEIWVDLE